LSIPAYLDAPFGGNLYLFGAFSADLYGMSSPVFYRIRATRAGMPTAVTYLDDPLVKTRYTVVDFTTGEVAAERVRLGPDDDGGNPECLVDGKPVCYALTPLSSGSNTFWSFPDLLAIWHTAGLNGKYELNLEVVGLADPTKFDGVDNTSLTLHLDNEAPVARIEPIAPGDDPATPRVYTPGPGAPEPTSNDLQSTALGSIPASYGGSVNPVCDILNLEGDAPAKYLAFKLTAHHANGYMRYWRFAFHRNDGGYQTHVGKRYRGQQSDPSEPTMVDFDSPAVDSLERDEGGFENRYLYLSNSDLVYAGGTSAPSCGYRFVIDAATRATDGYYYLRWFRDEDVHYVVRE
jgi:hypothetical protein